MISNSITSGITSNVIKNINPNFFAWIHCFNCIHSFRTKDKLDSYKNVFENKDFCDIVMRSKDTKIYKNLTNIRNLINTFYFYAGLESLIENTDRCKSNPDKPSPTKVRSNIHSGFSISTVWSFKDRK